VTEDAVSAARLLSTDLLAEHLVLSGAGALTFEDGRTIEPRPGVLVRLREGDRTSWEITERLRSLYVV
jgi:uncharacterized cupin superfamily protein